MSSSSSTTTTTPAPTTTHTLVSAPGKVLVAGGYLVLDPKYEGIVVSTSSRFYTLVRNRDDTTAAASADGRTHRIRVRSPQFQDAEWEYTTTTTIPTQEGVDLMNVEESSSSRNKFVYLALSKTIALAVELKGIEHVERCLGGKEGGLLDVVILGDNDFYSQRAKLQSLNLPRTLASLAKIPPFNHTGVTLSNVHKTGLGSSAALITSLVTALLLHLGVISESAFLSSSASSRSDDDDTNNDNNNDSDERKLAHNLAQYVHCLAQGKVGSGFDVASATFGSQLYRRFDPGVIAGLMNDENSRNQRLLPVLSPSNPAWDYRVGSFQLPPLTRLMLADVDAGSDTPSLVGKVLKWRKENSAQAHGLWTSIDQLNQSLAQTLLQLSQLYAQDVQSYTSAVKYISSLQPIQWLGNPTLAPRQAPIINTFFQAHQISQAIRQKMREMGQLAGVPIEPDEQKRLLDKCMSLAGVVGGGVPGAGGYDAVWILACDPVDCTPDQPPCDRVERAWNTWTEMEVSPLSAVESRERGARVERVGDVKGLSDVLGVLV